MQWNKSQKIIVCIVGACLVASVLNIAAMVTVSKIWNAPLSIKTIYFSILPGTLTGAFLLGYWLEFKGWSWGILIPIISMILASFSHPDKVHTTVLIYVLQIVPAGIVGEIGFRLKQYK